MKIALQAASLTALIALAFSPSHAFGEDGAEKTDSRVRVVEKQLLLAQKGVESDARRADEVRLAAYKKECQARVKLLESAISTCEKKVKAAKSASDSKSEEALNLKLEDLKTELEAWKGNAEKKFAVRFEENAEGAEKETKPKNLTAAQQAAMRALFGTKEKIQLFRPDHPNGSFPITQNGLVQGPENNKGTWRFQKNNVIEVVWDGGYKCLISPMKDDKGRPIPKQYSGCYSGPSGHGQGSYVLRVEEP